MTVVPRPHTAGASSSRMRMTSAGSSSFPCFERACALRSAEGRLAGRACVGLPRDRLTPWWFFASADRGARPFELLVGGGGCELVR